MPYKEFIIAYGDAVSEMAAVVYCSFIIKNEDMFAFGNLDGCPDIHQARRPFHVLAVKRCDGQRGNYIERAVFFRRRGTCE